MWLFPCVVHGNYFAKAFCRRPFIKRIRKFLSRSTRKQIQLPPLSPLLDQPRRHEEFFFSHIPGPSIFAPIERLKRHARRFIGGRKSSRRRPPRHHHPIIIVPWLALPLIELRPRGALSGERLQ